MAMPNTPIQQRAWLKDEQMAEFIKLTFEIMDDIQVACLVERWELICEERGWSLDSATEHLPPGLPESPL